MAGTLVANTAQAEAWNGYEGEHWAANDDRYDTINSGFNEPLLDAAGVGETSRVLDVGCGNGKLTRLAARRARHGHATGLDLSGPMLARARARGSPSRACLTCSARTSARCSLRPPRTCLRRRLRPRGRPARSPSLTRNGLARC